MIRSNIIVLLFLLLAGAVCRPAERINSPFESIPCSGSSELIYSDNFMPQALYLTCPSSYQDKTSPSTFAFPASSLAGNVPASVSLKTTEQADSYYTLDNTTPSQNSNQYTGAFAVAENAVLRYFSRDSSGNAEQSKFEIYKVDSTLPQILIQNLSAYLVNKSASITVQVKTDADAAFQLENRSRGNMNSGVKLTEGSLIADNWTNVTFNASSLDDGENQLYLFVTANGRTGYASFYIYRDDYPPIPQPNPDSLTFDAISQTVVLSTVEPAVIHYTLDGSSASSLSSIYSSPIILLSTTTLRAIAIDSAGNQGIEIIRTYTKNGPPAASFNPGASTTICNDQSVAIQFVKSMNTATYVLSGSMAAESNGGVWSTTALTDDTLTLSPTSGSWTNGNGRTFTINVSDLIANPLVVNVSYNVWGRYGVCRLGSMRLGP